jgi:methylmalonyl-CoA mutase cobalamin-binding subunit
MVKKLKEAVGNDCVLTVAGGVTTVEDVADLHKIGVEAQVRRHFIILIIFR